MADFYYAQGDGEQADQLYRRSLALKEKSLGMEHADLVKDLVGLGNLATKKGDQKEADQYYKRAEKISGKPVERG
jgi:tetratricopeptide (TPR) repeat protein